MYSGMLASGLPAVTVQSGQVACQISRIGNSMTGKRRAIAKGRGASVGEQGMTLQKGYGVSFGDDECSVDCGNGGTTLNS